MNIYARQGDLVFSKEAVTGELTITKNLVLAGNDTAPHTVKGSFLSRQDGRTTFLRITKRTSVTHDGRHLPVSLEPGDYRVYPLRERGDGTDRAVED
jgi:hypothetical protein